MNTTIPNELSRTLTRKEAIIAGLCNHLATFGWSPSETFDGDDYVPTACIEDVIEAVFSVDECTVTFIKFGCNDKGVLICAANNDDMICDHHMSDDSNPSDDFTAAIEAFEVILDALPVDAYTSR